jgi:hypothetical protein
VDIMVEIAVGRNRCDGRLYRPCTNRSDLPQTCSPLRTMCSLRRLNVLRWGKLCEDWGLHCCFLAGMVVVYQSAAKGVAGMMNGEGIEDNLWLR